MKINADFSQRVLVDTARLAWTPSPMPGVERRMLDRIGGEIARATSIVRYAPGSAFSQHTHDGGEEFIVLDGVFQDEHGDYPAGTYVRNPPTTHHMPASALGCTIFVKLWQFDPADRDQRVVDMNAREFDPAGGGAASATLHRDSRETISVCTLDAGATLPMGHRGGAEALVLRGAVSVDGTVLPERGWLRLPPGDHAEIVGAEGGARLWIKSGHLANVTAPPQ